MDYVEFVSIEVSFRIFECTWSLLMPGVTRTCFVVSSSDVIVSDCSDSEFDG